MSGFDEILGTEIEVRKRTLDQRSVDTDKDLPDAALDPDLFPEFSKLLEDHEPGDDDSQGCPLPGTPEDESLIDSKEVGEPADGKRALCCATTQVAIGLSSHHVLLVLE